MPQFTQSPAALLFSSKDCI